MTASIPAPALDAHIDRATSEVFEQMLFCAALPSPDAPLDWDDGELCWSEIALISPVQGRMRIAVAPDTAAALCDLMWAGECEDSEAAWLGLLDEVANAVGGRLLGNIDPENPPKLGLPTSGRGAGEGDLERRTVYELDDGSIIGIQLLD